MKITLDTRDPEEAKRRWPKAALEYDRRIEEAYHTQSTVYFLDARSGQL